MDETSGQFESNTKAINAKGSISENLRSENSMAEHSMSELNRLGQMDSMKNPSTDYNFLVVAGNIGSGKTTLTRMLSERLGWRSYFESVEENPYLGDFYEDMSRWSFPLQVYFLNHRFKTHKVIENNRASSIQDRSIYEDANIFARALFEQGNLTKRDFENYLCLYNSMIEHLTPPTLMIFLRRSVDGLKERIAMRGRDFEKDISTDYLTSLNKYYDDWYESYRGKRLIVETDDLDFIDKPEQFDQLVEKIFSSLEQRDLFFKF